VLQGLFDLTPAEARVAAAIAEGRTVEVIAAAANVSHETVRSQLKAVLGKAGVSRQVDLVQLLAGIALPGRGTP
jgi:DNA-binding CsgD family transcriptional regulator